MGKSVVVVSPGQAPRRPVERRPRLTDTGNKAVIGGLAREFYHRIWKHYERPDGLEVAGAARPTATAARGTPPSMAQQRTMWIFEPHVAEQVFEDCVARTGSRSSATSGSTARKGVKKHGAAHRLASPRSAGRDLRGQDVHRCHLRGRPDGRGRRDVPRGPRGATPSTAKSATACRSACSTTAIISAMKRSIPIVVPGDPSSGVLPRISADPPGEYGAGRPAGAGLLLPHVPHRCAGEPRAVSQAGRLRPAAIRTAPRGSSRPAGGSFRQVRPDPQPQDRHQQPRAVQHRQHRLQLRLSRGELRAPPRDHRPSTRPTRRACCGSLANDPRVPEDVRDEMRTVGPAQGRVHRQRPLAAPALHPRGPADGRPLRDDRERAAEEAPDARLRRHGLLHDGLAQRPALRHARGPRAKRGGHRRGHQRPLRDRLRLARAEAAAVREPARAGVPVGQRTSPTARSAWSRSS